MTEGTPAAVTARDRQRDLRSSNSASGLTLRDDRSEHWDRDSSLDLGDLTRSQQEVSSIDVDSQEDLNADQSFSDRRAPHEAQSSATESLAPTSIPTLPLAIDSMPLTSAPLSTLHSPPSLHQPPLSPPQTRMRRVSRRSPNARSERAAPSSISTTEFSDLPPRPHQRRGSLGSLPSARSRAHSHSPPPRDSQQAEASGSRSRRNIDPDQHWLSEDEATGTVGGTAGARQRTSGRRRGVTTGFGSDDDEGTSDRRKPRIDEIFASRFGKASHEIHHRPSNFTGLPSTAIPPMLANDANSFSAIVPRLLSILACPHCHDLLSTPVTFGCGHSRCKDCLSSKKSTTFSPEIPSITALPVSTSLLPLPSDTSHHPQPPPGKDLSNPVAAFLPGSFPDQLKQQPSSQPPSKPLSTKSVSPSPPSLPSCGIDNCRHAEFVPLPALYSEGPKTDYNLRKILDHLRKAMSETALASLVDSSTKEQQHRPHLSVVDDASVGDSKEKSVNRMPSDSSGSSGGGEEITKGQDDGKRAHKHRAGYKSVKVAKKTRRLPESAVVTGESAEEKEEEEDETLDPSTTDSTSHLDTALSDIASTFFADVQAESECQVCVQLLVEAITSPCGHSFCRNCLTRAYDHSSKCPLCRSDLPPLPYFNRERTNIALHSVIETAFPTLAAERAAGIREDELAHLSNVPIFICTTAWPGIPTFLHIFEPRYRLMMRRALESPSREFGMVLPSRDGSGGVNEYGTMLRITNCNVMEDGRSIVHSVGTWRFKIIERWMVDGYNVGRVERVEDVSLEQELELEQCALRSNHDELAEYRDPDPAPALGGGGISLTQRPSRPPMTGNMELAIDQLMQICFDFIKTLKSQSAPWVLQRLNNTVGEMPTTPAEFTWWCGEVMPVEDHVKVALLSITSVRERLRLIVFWIEQFRSSWWYSRGCNIM
ncbi:uncharacterized protein JCM6883_005622 [Sporobolomyces salmoneus]|uniref:uncharacterized protein n=1 Tax=Sporobolomyces salmoneus TaxID=183962 RepID=UPI00317E1082